MMVVTVLGHESVPTSKKVLTSESDSRFRARKLATIPTVIALGKNHANACRATPDVTALNKSTIDRRGRDDQRDSRFVCCRPFGFGRGGGFGRLGTPGGREFIHGA
jgi:hypothetical protein